MAAPTFSTFAFDRIGFYDGVADKLVALLRRTGGSRVLDRPLAEGRHRCRFVADVRGAGLSTNSSLAMAFQRSRAGAHRRAG